MFHSSPVQAGRRHSMEMVYETTPRRGCEVFVSQPMSLASGRRGSVAASFISEPPRSLQGSPLPAARARRGSMELFVDIPLTKETVSDVPWTNDVTVIRQERDQAGVYGIGVRVDINPPNPFMVLSVNNLWDQSDQDISNSITVGDKLVYVNDRSVVKEGESIIQSTILGERNSLVKLTLESRQTGQLYERVVKRHIPVRTWEFTRKWYEVKDEFRGKDLATNDSIVRALDGMRRAVIASDGRDMDFLAGIKKAGSSCGMHLKGRYVLKVIKGSPAHMAQIQDGDTILSVDGMSGEEQIADALGSHQRIGSICKVGIVRRSDRFEVEVQRTQISGMHRTEELIDFVEHSCQHDRNLEAAIMEYVVGLERERQYEERVMAGRLNRMATSLLQNVTRAANTLGPVKGPDFDIEALMASERRERTRGDSLADQLRDAQGRIEALSRSEANLKEQLERLKLQMASMVPASELRSSQAECEDLRRQLEALKAEMAGMVPRGELEAAQRESEDLRKQLEALRQEMATMVPRSELDKAEQALRAAQEQVEDLRKQVKALTEREADLTKQVEALKAEMAGMVPRGELEAAQRESEDLRKQLEALRQEMATMVPRSELDKVEAELKASKERVAELEKKVSGLEAGLLASQKDCEDLRQKLAKAEQELKTTKELAEDLKKQNEALNATVGQLEKQVEGLEAKVVTMLAPDFDSKGCAFPDKFPLTITGRAGSKIYATVRPSGGEVVPPTIEAFDKCVESPLVLLLDASTVVSVASSMDGVTLSPVRTEEFTLEPPAPPPPEMVGVGMVLSRPKDAGVMAEVCVKEIDEGSPVQLNRTIAVGDVLVEVDGTSVEDRSMSDISDLILGPIGSEVSLVFKSKREDQGTYTVKLTRDRTEKQVGVGMMLSRPKPKAEVSGDEAQSSGASGADVSRNIVVKEIYPGCAVAENGVIEVGDIVLQINGQHVAEMTMDDIERLIKGKQGSEITFAVQKPSEETVEVTLIRQKEPDGIVTRVFDTSISLFDGGKNIVMGSVGTLQSLLTPRKGSVIMYPDGSSERVYWAV